MQFFSRKWSNKIRKIGIISGLQLILIIQLTACSNEKEANQNSPPFGPLTAASTAVALVTATLPGTSPAFTSSTLAKNISFPDFLASKQLRLNTSPQALTYLKEALGYIYNNSILRTTVDWSLVWVEVIPLVQNAQNTSDTYPAIESVLAKVGTEHSFFRTPEEYKQTYSGRKFGLGLSVLNRSGAITEIFPGGPADKAGLKAGDRIEAIDGQSSKVEAQATFLTSRTTPVTLKLLRIGQPQPFEVTLVPVEFDDGRNPSGKLLNNGLGFLELPAVTGPAQMISEYAFHAQKTISDIDSNSKVCGWIVDLRRAYTGGLWQMIAGAGPLLGDGALGSFIYSDKKEIWSYQKGKAFDGSNLLAQSSFVYELKKTQPPIAVLTSNSTASGGESILIAFRGHTLTKTFGEASAGFPTANDAMVLSDGAQIVLTVAYEADRTGYIYKGKIAPDEAVSIDWSLIESDQDPVVIKASEWLKTQPGCQT